MKSENTASIGRDNIEGVECLSSGFPVTSSTENNFGCAFINASLARAPIASIKYQAVAREGEDRTFKYEFPLRLYLNNIREVLGEVATNSVTKDRFLEWGVVDSYLHNMTSSNLERLLGNMDYIDGEGYIYKAIDAANNILNRKFPPGKDAIKQLILSKSAKLKINDLQYQNRGVVFTSSYLKQRVLTGHNYTGSIYVSPNVFYRIGMPERIAVRAISNTREKEIESQVRDKLRGFIVDENEDILEDNFPEGPVYLTRNLYEQAVQEELQKTITKQAEIMRKNRSFK